MVSAMDAVGGLTDAMGSFGLAQPAGWVTPDELSASAASPGGSSATRSARAVKDFETLFVETLLQHAGFAQALDSEGGTPGSVVGELFVREIARNLSGQLHLGFAQQLEAVK